MVPTERKLIKNGIVLSLDPQIGEVNGCDVLIDGEIGSSPSAEAWRQKEPRSSTPPA